MRLLLALPLTLLLEDARTAGAVSVRSAKARKAEEGPKIGLALQGGSVTAANICGSTMRGFQQQKITVNGEEKPAMDAFDYTAGLSGGNFANLMYAYAQGTTSDDLLDVGGIVDPEDITAESLRTVPENSMFAPFVRSVIPSIIRAVVGAALFKWDFWVQVVYYHFLEPVGIPANKTIGSEDVPQREDAKPMPVVEFSMTGPSELYPEWIYQHMNQEAVADINAAAVNQSTVELSPFFIERWQALEEMWGFTFPPSYLEFYQMSPEVVLEAAKKSGWQVPVPAFATPEEIHMPFVDATMEFDPVSNVTAEPLNFKPFVAGTTDPAVGMVTLERLLAFGTALVPILLNGEVVSALPQEFKDLLSVPLELNIPTSDNSQRSMAFADGGYNDRSGIPALVSLKCPTIVSVLFPTGGGINSLGRDPVIWIFNSIAGLFGVTIRGIPLNAASFSVGMDYGLHMFDLFSNGENQLNKAIEIIRKQHEAGNPLIVTLENLDVIANPFWGTEAGEKVDLTIILAVGIPKRFSDRISLEAAPPAPNQTLVDEDGFFTNPDLNYAPNSLSSRNIVLFEDITDDEGNVIIPLEEETTIDIPLEYALGVEETRMTNFLMSWIVKDAWDGLKDVDGNVIFGGFKSILDTAEGAEVTTAMPAATTPAASTPAATAPAATTPVVEVTTTTTEPSGAEVVVADDTAMTTDAPGEVMTKGTSSPAARMVTSIFAAALAMGALAFAAL